MTKALVFLTFASSVLFSQVSFAKYCQTHNGIYLAHHHFYYRADIDLVKSGLTQYSTGGAQMYVNKDLDNGWNLGYAKGTQGIMTKNVPIVVLAKDQNNCWDVPALPSGVVLLWDMEMWAFADVVTFPGVTRNMARTKLKDGQSLFCHGTTGNTWCDVVDETY